jgi:polysaccharide pyruvyl transferase WcaK-like protein
MDLALAMTVDSVRLALWVRRHETVIVPGMGLLEATVPMRPWKSPYRMFLLCASGRLFGTKVALVSTGANFIDEPIIRMLVTTAARLAYYRSFRDTISRDAMERMGLDTSSDAVYPDVVFSLPTRQGPQATARSVGIGVMDYCGRNVDRQQADDIRSSYIEKITEFALWLVDNGRTIRLITSDPAADAKIIQAVVASLRGHRPRLGPSQVIAQPITSLGELMRQLALVDTVVATRYHNVLFAMKLAKPTISLSYAGKCDVLMADMGLSSFCHPISSLDVARLIEQFNELEAKWTEVQVTLRQRAAARESLVGRQFADLSEALFPPARDAPLKVAASSN